MAGENGKGFGGFFGRFRERFEKLSESVTSGTKDDMDLILAAIQRIDLEGEEVPSSGAQPKEMGEEEIYESIMRRLQWQLSRSGITSDELIRTFPGEVQAVLLYRSYDKFKGVESNLLRERFIEMGWRNIQPNLWVLPPNKTPGGSATSGDLKVWLRKNLAKPFGKDFDYVFPVVAVIDMKKVTADKKGIRKMPTARTIYNVLEPDEIVPASHLYSVMKTRGFGVRDIILSGNIPFLASAFATSEELSAIEENADAIAASLRQMTGSQLVNLQDIANLGPDLLADAFGSTLVHGKDLAQRLIVEAQFWMRYLGGSVPAPGPMPTTQLPTQPQTEEKKEQEEQTEQRGEQKEAPVEEEPKPVASTESWYESGEKTGEESEEDETDAAQAVAQATVRDDQQHS